MSSDATHAVRIESIRAVYRHLPLTLGASAVNAIVTAVVLAPRAGTGPVALWLAGFAAMLLPRFLAWRRFTRRPAAALAAPVWSRMAVAGSFVSGALWGACSLWLMPDEAPYPVFVAFVIGGMCAGAITVNATHLRSVAAFILAADLPLAGRLAWQGGTLGLPMAAMTLLFAGALLITARRYADQFAEGVRARIALGERTEELACANAQLRAEIAEREQAEAALRQAQKMEAIGSLTSGVAHDVNNVLMVVRGAAETLKRRLAHTPGHLRQIAAILRATERGATLTRQLLAFARKEVLHPAAVDVNAMLRGIGALLEATLGKSVRLDLEFTAKLRPAFIDRSSLEHAIINLAINARDAMPDGGTLTFRTSALTLDEPDPALDLPAGCYAEITVSDTGRGMSETVLARAFDPFFTTKPPGQGSGLGLSQVYGLLRQSGGGVRLESAPGRGTAVHLFIPLAKTGAATVSEPDLLSARAPEPTAEGKSSHIVVLDDEDMVREVVVELLESAGYRVSAFARANDALRVIESDAAIALLISDLGLPDRAGDEVARDARLLRPSLPVLFITGYNDPALLAEEPWQLRKPFSESELLAMVAHALRQRSAAN